MKLKNTQHIIKYMSILLNQYVKNWVNDQGSWKEILKNVGENKPSINIARNIERLIEKYNEKNISNTTNKIWQTFLLLMILNGTIQAEKEGNTVQTSTTTIRAYDCYQAVIGEIYSLISAQECSNILLTEIETEETLLTRYIKNLNTLLLKLGNVE